MKLLPLTIVAAFCLALPSALFAQETKKKAETAPAATAKKAETAAGAAADAGAKTAKKAATRPMPMNARADSISASRNTFTQKTEDGREIKHSISDTTEIRNGDAPAKLADIKEGDWVSGTRIKKNDTEYDVVKITKFGPRAEKAEAKEAARDAAKAAKAAKKEAAKPEERVTEKK